MSRRQFLAAAGAGGALAGTASTRCAPTPGQEQFERAHDKGMALSPGQALNLASGKVSQADLLA